MAKKIYTQKFVPDTHKGSVFIYVLFSVVFFMLTFTSIVFLMNKNLEYVDKANTTNKLLFDSRSNLQKFLGWFQSGPRNQVLANVANVSYEGYYDTLSGYVYKGKSDIVTIDWNKYIDDTSMPVAVAIEREQGSTGTLYATLRKVVDTNEQIVQSETLPFQGNTIIVENDYDNMFNPRDQSNKIVFKTEIILFSDAGARYRIKALDRAAANQNTNGIMNLNVNARFVTDKLYATVTSTTDTNQIGSQDSLSSSNSITLTPTSYNMLSKFDFEAGNHNFNGVLSSSLNEPGLSTAYIDFLDVESAADWTTNGNYSYNGGLVLSPGSTYTLKQSLSGDLDARVTMNTTPAVEKSTNDSAITGTIPGEAGIFVKSGSSEYRAGIKQVDICREETIPLVGVTCTCDQPKNAYIFYERSAGSPARFRDDTTSDSGPCASYPKLSTINGQGKVFESVSTNTNVNGTLVTSSKFMLNIRKENGKIDAYYCKEGNKCDTTGYNWPLISENPFSIASGSGTTSFGLYNDSHTGPPRYSYVRVSQTSQASSYPHYVKNIDFGKEVTIKQIEINGYIPAGSDFGVRLGYTKGNQTYNVCQGNETGGVCKDSSLVINPVDESKNALPAVSQLNMDLSLENPTFGDLSATPFIRGIRIYYEQN